MHFDNLQPGLSAPLIRADDDDEDDDEKESPESKNRHAPVAMLMQKKFLERLLDGHIDRADKLKLPKSSASPRKTRRSGERTPHFLLSG